jgi:hypothetical protein
VKINFLIDAKAYEKITHFSLNLTLDNNRNDGLPTVLFRSLIDPFQSSQAIIDNYSIVALEREFS